MATRRIANKDSISVGISFGTALAMISSWSVNGSILWAMLHGVFSWFYVIYFVIEYHW